jgi:hypothetical protein
MCVYQLIEGGDRFDTKMAHWRENETKVYLALECLVGFRTQYRNLWINGHFIRVDVTKEVTLPELLKAALEEDEYCLLPSLPSYFPLCLWYYMYCTYIDVLILLLTGDTILLLLFITT